jgi:hypothetical protein
LQCQLFINGYRTEKDTGVAAPIKISNPDAKGSRIVFVAHKSVIDYVNSGFNKII